MACPKQSIFRLLIVYSNTRRIKYCISHIYQQSIINLRHLSAHAFPRVAKCLPTEVSDHDKSCEFSDGPASIIKGLLVKSERWMK